jgi:hypothetical protein
MDSISVFIRVKREEVEDASDSKIKRALKFEAGHCGTT